jgi:uncharacterized protein YqeY
MSQSLSEQITSALKDAMRAKDTERLRALRMVRAAFIEVEKQAGTTDEAGYLAILRRLRKQRVDAAEQYRKGGRPELADEEEAEILVIDAFLPQLADEDTTRGWIQEAIANSGATSPSDLGRVMGVLMKAHKGLVDGNLARRLAQEELGT